MATRRERLKRSWKFLMTIVAPFILLPVYFAIDDEFIPNIPYKSRMLPEEDFNGDSSDEDGYDEVNASPSRKFKLAYVILVMAVYWAFEVLPLPITSLFPLVLFPLFGIDDASNVSKSYMKESNTIFLGGAIVALAVEFCNLHRRVALRLITIVGVSPHRLMFGIMVVVSFLSMFISNTTSTAMLVPLIVAIVDEIHEVTDATNEDLEANNNSMPPATQSQSRPLSRAPSLRRTISQQSQPGTPSLNRHSSAFANAALASHHSGQATPEEDDGRTSTLGILQGHRSDPEDDVEIHHPHPEAYIINLEHNHNVDWRSSSNKASHINVNKSGHLTSIQEELPQEERKIPTLKRSTSEPGRIERMMHLHSSSFDAVDEPERLQKIEKEKWRRIKNMYLFALAYAANIGGTATITGTGPNKVFKEAIKPYSYDISQGGSLSMTFFTWMALNVPPMLVNVGVAFAYLTIKYCGFPKLSFSKKTPEDEAKHAVEQWKDQHVRSYLMDEYKKLGKMNFHEIGVALVFLLVVFLWIFRDPQIFTGWGRYSDGDSTAALLGVILLFVIPRNWNFLSSKDDAHFEALLDWKFVTQKLPWGVLLLLGSGYAIGDSADRTGLTKWIGKELWLLHDLPQPLLLLIIMLITAFITEVVSNTAAASIILPVLLGLSREMKIHPLYLSVAASVTASYAFMLPVASPVNAIVFAAGEFSIWEMIQNGYILNGICVIIFYINTLTLGECLFQYSTFQYPAATATTTAMTTPQM